MVPLSAFNEGVTNKELSQGRHHAFTCFKVSANTLISYPYDNFSCIFLHFSCTSGALHETHEWSILANLKWHILSNRLVPSCFTIFDLEPLSLSFDFVFTFEISKYLSFSLERLCRLAILCLDQHAHTLHHLESLLTISLDRLDILKEDLLAYERLVMNPTSAGMRHLHLYPYMNPEIKQLAIKRVDEYGFVILPDLIQRISLTGFPAQSVGSSNTDVLDLPCLLVLITGTSQSRQHDMSESDSYYLSD
ncbi:hypothetical protein Tco_0999821 [Tanacetum coccineum]